MIRFRRVLVCLPIGLAVFSALAKVPDSTAFRWEPDIRAFEKADSLQPPPKEAVLFVGSSSIAMWDSLATDFPGIPVIRRGFGGSQIEDVIRCAQRIILPYHPRLAVLYAGDNDLASGKTPERVADDFKALADTILSHLPRTRFVFISIKPSPARWHLIHAVRTTNGLIESVCRINPRLAFADVSTPMLGPNGRPRPELFTPDSLHINRAGYRLWKSVIDPLMRLP